MQWVLLCAFSVFTTALSANVQSAETPKECLNRVTMDCSKNIATTINPSGTPDVCRIVQDVVKCIEDGVKACKVNLDEDKDLKEYINIFTDMCKEGTDLNAKFLKGKECLMGRSLLLDAVPCMQDVSKAVKDLGINMQDPNKINENNQLTISKTVCRYLDDLKSCLYTKVTHTCGAETQSFVQTVMEPLYKQGKAYCALIGGAANLSVNFTYFILHIFSLLFLFKWFNF